MRKNLSFSRRVGRKLSINKLRLLNEFMKESNLQTGVTIENDKVIFPKKENSKNILEIGFGNGDFLYNISSKNPNDNFVGCEPYLSGVVSLLTRIEQFSHKNIYIWSDDANIFLDKVDEDTLDEVYILFSDPWPKVKHHKKRIINKEFIEKLSVKMKRSARVVIATDHLEYAKWILNIMISSDYFAPIAENAEDWYNNNENSVKTKYEMKAEKQHIKSFYFHFEKNF